MKKNGSCTFSAPIIKEEELRFSLVKYQHSLQSQICIAKKSSWWGSRRIVYHELLKPCEIVTDGCHHAQVNDIQHGKNHFYYQKICCNNFASKTTVEVIFNSVWEHQSHVAYSPYLSHSDYHMSISYPTLSWGTKVEDVHKRHLSQWQQYATKLDHKRPFIARSRLGKLHFQRQVNFEEK